MASIYANLSEQMKAFSSEKSITPTGFVWNTNIVIVSLFWNANMAAVIGADLGFFLGGGAPLTDR